MAKTATLTMSMGSCVLLVSFFFFNSSTYKPLSLHYHETTCAHCDGYDSLLRPPSACDRISPATFYSQPFESAVEQQAFSMQLQISEIWFQKSLQKFYREAQQDAQMVQKNPTNQRKHAPSEHALTTKSGTYT